MTMGAGAASRWSVLRANAKKAWGRLIADQWLQLEGQRELRANHYEENPWFAQNRRPYQSPEPAPEVLRGLAGSHPPCSLAQPEVNRGDA
jgi:hypothetical protein